VNASGAHPALLALARDALKGEMGARSIYAQLAPRMRDRELGQVLERFRDDETEIVAGVRALVIGLGASRAPERCRSRAWTGWFLAVCSRGRTASIALRLCHDAESTAGRVYGEMSLHLASTGDVERAQTCAGFAEIKQRHARILEAWVVR
jgi:rubrerythrin